MKDEKLLGLTQWQTFFNLLSTNSKKLIERNCNGLTDSSTLQIANDPKIKLIFIIPEQSSDQDGLRN